MRNKSYLLRVIVSLACLDAILSQVELNPGDNYQEIIDDNPEGTVFLIKAGVHRFFSVVPKNDQVFNGENGAILTGARILSSWTPYNTDFWMSDLGEALEPIQPHGECMNEDVACKNNEDLMYDSTPIRYRRVSLQAMMEIGGYFIEYAAGKVYTSIDPTGKTMELSVTRAAFSGPATGVQIRNLRIQNYATPAQMGAIGDQVVGEGWTVENCDITLNHGRGITGYSNWIIRSNKIHNNGHMGWSVSGDNVLFELNEVYDNNNYGGFFVPWEGGACKIALSKNFVGRNNYVHDSEGSGFWTDIDNSDCLIEGNLIERMRAEGIKHEISQSCTFRNNIVRDAGMEGRVWCWASGINIQNSRDVIVTNNVVYGGERNGIIVMNQDRGGSYNTVENISIIGNHVVHSGLGYSGMCNDYDRYGNFYESASGNMFDYNTYHVVDNNHPYWLWGEGANDGYNTWDQFRSYLNNPQELNGQRLSLSDDGWSDNAPSLTVNSDLSQTFPVNQDLTISITASDDIYVHKVYVEIDGEEIDTKFFSPYDVTIPPNKMTPGAHQIRVAVVDVGRQETFAESTIQVATCPASGPSSAGPVATSPNSVAVSTPHQSATATTVAVQSIIGQAVIVAASSLLLA